MWGLTGFLHKVHSHIALVSLRQGFRIPQDRDLTYAFSISLYLISAVVLLEVASFLTHLIFRN